MPREFGTAVWTLSDGVRFFSALAAGCLLPAADTEFVLDEMRSVTREQRWGIPARLPSSRSVAFKGGWGPDPDDSGHWLVEQFAIIDGAEPAVVGVMARSRRAARSLEDDSAFIGGTRLIEENSDRALKLAREPFSQGACPRTTR